MALGGPSEVARGIAAGPSGECPPGSGLDIVADEPHRPVAEQHADPPGVETAGGRLAGVVRPVAAVPAAVVGQQVVVVVRVGVVAVDPLRPAYPGPDRPAAGRP